VAGAEFRMQLPADEQQDALRSIKSEPQVVQGIHVKVARAEASNLKDKEETLHDLETTLGIDKNNEDVKTASVMAFKELSTKMITPTSPAEVSRYQEKRVAAIEQDITDEGVKALASGCGRVTSVNFGSCTHITDQGVKALVSACGGLTSVNFEKCNNITDEGVKALESSCTSVKVWKATQAAAGSRETDCVPQPWDLLALHGVPLPRYTSSRGFVRSA